MFRIICIAALACLCFGFAAIAADEKGSIEGTVIDSDTKDPIEAATVDIESPFKTVDTDSDGKYTFENLNPGEYEITVSAKKYKEAKGTTDVVAGEVSRLNFSVKPNISWFRKFLRAFSSWPMIEFYICMGTFLVVWGIAAFLARLIDSGYADRSANTAWLVALIIHIIVGISLAIHVSFTSFRDREWAFAWLYPFLALLLFLAFLFVDIILISFLIKQRGSLRHVQ